MSDAALSSPATAGGDLAKRVTELVEGLANEQQDLALELFEVERSLNGDHRRSRKVVEGAA